MGCQKLIYHQDPAIGANWKIFTSGKEKTVSTSNFCIDYYTFGMQMPGRNGSTGDYRYGFNGMEKDDEVKGEGNSIDFGARIYDSRIGRWLSRDPLERSYPKDSPYGYVQNSPVYYIDPDGKDVVPHLKGKNLSTYTEIYDILKNTFTFGENIYCQIEAKSAYDIEYTINVKMMEVSDPNTGSAFGYQRITDAEGTNGKVSKLESEVRLRKDGVTFGTISEELIHAAQSQFYIANNGKPAKAIVMETEAKIMKSFAYLNAQFGHNQSGDGNQESWVQDNYDYQENGLNASALNDYKSMYSRMKSDGFREYELNNIFTKDNDGNVTGYNKTFIDAYYTQESGEDWSEFVNNFSKSVATEYSKNPDSTISSSDRATSSDLELLNQTTTNRK